MNRTTVLLVDDHPVVRTGYRHLLDTTNDLEVVAEAECSEGAYDAYRRFRPEVVVMDVRIPGEGGISTAGRILAHDGQAKILCFSMHSGGPVVARALGQGVRGYVTKHSPPGRLIEAIRTIARGHTYLDPEVAHLVDERGELASLDALSRREFDVFRLLAQGAPIGEVARTLSISPKTAAIHKVNILRKLRVHNLVQLAHLAIGAGVIPVWTPTDQN